VSIFRQKITSIMFHQAYESDSSSRCLSPITVWCTDDGSVATSGSVPADPISKRLVSSYFSPAQQIELIREMLADRSEQQAARALEPEEASKFVEMLDLVRLFSPPHHRCLTGSRS
jgi:hypothetical protein